ncbi:MAG: FHA domain-containing protein, partial [Acidobacteriota bacterium]
MAYRLSVSIEGRRHRRVLTLGENLVGSAATCDLRIEHPSVSRHHAAVLLVDGGGAIEVADLGSRNGTHING